MLKKFIDSGKWDAILRRIGSLKEDINRDFIELKRDDLALLNDLGSWLEGYRLTVEAMSLNYRESDSSILIQRQLIAYLLKELKSSERLKSFNRYGNLVNLLEQILSVIDDGRGYSLSKESVDRLSKIFRSSGVI